MQHCPLSPPHRPSVHTADSAKVRKTKPNMVRTKWTDLHSTDILLFIYVYIESFKCWMAVGSIYSVPWYTCSSLFFFSFRILWCRCCCDGSSNTCRYVVFCFWQSFRLIVADKLHWPVSSVHGHVNTQYSRCLYAFSHFFFSSSLLAFSSSLLFLFFVVVLPLCSRRP